MRLPYIKGTTSGKRMDFPFIRAVLHPAANKNTPVLPEGKNVY